MAISRIVECVLRDQRRILTVSSLASSHYALGESLVMSLPCIVGRAGVVSRLPLALDHHERHMLERSAAILERAYSNQGAASGDPRVSRNGTEPGGPGSEPARLAGSGDG